MGLAKRQLAVAAILLMIPMSAWTYEEVEDLVALFVTDDRFVAAVDGQRNFSEKISLGETVVWEGAKGEVGAILTDERLLAVSIASGGWNRINLKIKEKQTPPDMLLGAHLLVMLSDDRIVTFGTQTGGFFQTRLPIREPVVAKAAEGRVAAVVTTAFAYGLSANRRGAAEFRLRRQEKIVSMKTTYNKITLQTSERLVSFDAENAAWREFNL